MPLYSAFKREVFYILHSGGQPFIIDQLFARKTFPPYIDASLFFRTLFQMQDVRTQFAPGRLNNKDDVASDITDVQFNISFYVASVPLICLGNLWCITKAKKNHTITYYLAAGFFQKHTSTGADLDHQTIWARGTSVRLTSTYVLGLPVKARTSEILGKPNAGTR